MACRDIHEVKQPGVLIGYCDHQMHRLMTKKLRQYDVSPMQCRTLTYLQEAEGQVNQRMLEQQSAQRLYAALGRHLKFADGWKKYIITSEPEFEHYFGKRADKKRKLYNGMIKCDYYMYFEDRKK